MEDLVGIVIRVEVTIGPEGVLLEAFGKRQDGSSGGFFTSAKRKMDEIATKYGGKPVDLQKPEERNTFYKAILFPNADALKAFQKNLSE